MKIGLLDFGYFNPDINNPVDLLNFTFDFVRQLEEMNFSRYWMAEHYNDYCTWTNPEILLTVLAGMTERINIGAAGILIYFHSPYRVATAFKMLSTLFPGRIDLGLARGDVHPHMVKHLVGTPKLSNRVYKETESRLLNYLFDHKLYDHQGRMVPLPPYGGSHTNTWTLGTSRASALNSLKLNTNFSLSLFHEKNTIPEYKDIWLNYCDEKERMQAYHLNENLAVQYTAIADKRRLKEFAAQHKVTYNNQDSPRIIGEPSYCEDKLYRYFETFGVKEIIIHDLSRDLNQRMETVNSISKFNLQPVQ